MVTHNFDDEDVQENKTVSCEGQNLIKASLFNLIVIADSVQRALHCQELVRLVTEKFPCRVIFVQSDVSSQADFFHTGHTLEAIGTGTNRVCFDQYIIESSVNQLHKVPFLILPYIMPDLPVYILLGSDPTLERVILPQLQKDANRVIFDCESIDNMQRFSERMLAALHDKHTDFIDVNWARTKAWREVMARVFNDLEKLELLGQSKMIQISFAGRSIQHQPKNEIQAIYLQAWLASQLGWSLLNVEKEDGYLRLSYHAGSSPITISLVPKDTDAVDTGAIFSVEVMTHNDAHFLISHERERQHVAVHSSTIERCEMPYTLFLSNYQRGTALVNEIFYQPLSEHYQGMLQALNHTEWGQSL